MKDLDKKELAYLKSKCALKEAEADLQETKEEFNWRKQRAKEAREEFYEKMSQYLLAKHSLKIGGKIEVDGELCILRGSHWGGIPWSAENSPAATGRKERRLYRATFGMRNRLPRGNLAPSN